MVDLTEIEKNGYLTLEALQEAGHVPPEDRIKRGGVVMTECIQEIPCNPCVASCPFGAISMENINSDPVVDFDKCVGCRSCMKKCPGLAIFYMDGSGENGIVGLPYEMRPLPEVGEVVDVTDRAGKVIGKGTINRIEYTPEHDRTAIVLVEVPHDIILHARHFLRGDA